MFSDIPLLTSCGTRSAIKPTIRWNDILAELREARRNIFLDLKLHDIPNTVAGAIRSVVRSGASFVTVTC